MIATMTPMPGISVPIRFSGLSADGISRYVCPNKSIKSLMTKMVNPSGIIPKGLQQLLFLIFSSKHYINTFNLSLINYLSFFSFSFSVFESPDSLLKFFFLCICFSALCYILRFSVLKSVSYQPSPLNLKFGAEISPLNLSLNRLGNQSSGYH